VARKIDRWLPVEEISEQSARERSFAVMTPLNKLHVWWARRPLTASRAATLLTLVPEDADEDKLTRILGLHSKDAWKFSPLRERRLREQLREWFREATGSERPLVVDPMAGGGSIPFEALRLGCRVIAGEYNPVAWLILKATLEYPVEHGGELLERMREFFTEVRRELERRVSDFYGGNDRAYVWIKWIECPSCGLKVPTRPNWWLLRKQGKPEESYVILPDVPEDGDEVEFDVVKYSEVKDEFDPTREGTVNRGVVTCPRCGAKIRREQVHSLFRRQFEGEPPEDRPFVRAYLAAVARGANRNRRVTKATTQDVERFRAAREILLERWDDLVMKNLIPTEKVPRLHPKYDGEIRGKGVDKFYKFFNERQLLAHSMLLETIADIHIGLDNCDEKYDEPVLAYTMVSFGKVVNYNSILTVWHPRGYVANTFRYHAYPWSWDHGEVNVVRRWEFSVESTMEVYEELVKLLRGVREKPEVVLGDARELPALLDEKPDAIVVDPPYYDNVQYAELADFFYVWLKRSPVAEVLPEGFLSELTPKDEEVVKNPARQEDPDEEYERLLRESFEAMREALSEDGRLTVMFTHRQLRAWDTLVRTLRDAGFRVNAAWPVWTEAQWSLHQREKAAVRYTLILACEPREGDGEEAWWSDVQDKVRERVEEAVELAERQGLEGVDKLVVAYGAALSAYTGYERVLDEETGEEVEPELVLDEARRVVADLELEELEAGGLDEEGRFYVLYRAFYGYPSKSGAPDWDEVRRLGLVLGVDPEDLGYVERYRGRAYLRSFEDREKEELSPDGSSVDALHLALHRLDEGREAVQEVVKEADGVVELARALAAVARRRYGDPEEYPRELRWVMSLLSTLGESPPGQRTLDEY